MVRHAGSTRKTPRLVRVFWTHADDRGAGKILDLLGAQRPTDRRTSRRYRSMTYMGSKCHLPLTYPEKYGFFESRIRTFRAATGQSTGLASSGISATRHKWAGMLGRW